MRGPNVSSAEGDGPTFNWTAGSIFPWLMVPEDSSDVSALTVGVRLIAVRDTIQPKFSEGVACVVSKSQS